jgi:hypothetical protein
MALPEGKSRVAPDSTGLNWRKCLGVEPKTLISNRSKSLHLVDDPFIGAMNAVVLSSRAWMLGSLL